MTLDWTGTTGHSPVSAPPLAQLAFTVALSRAGRLVGSGAQTNTERQGR